MALDDREKRLTAVTTTQEYIRRYTQKSEPVDIEGLKNWISENFQPKLVSGENIKTINNETVLGSGNLPIQGGGSADGHLVCDELFNGATTTANITLTDAYNDYLFYVCIVKVNSSNTGYNTGIIPKDVIPTQTTGWSISIADETNYDSRYWYHTGNNVIVRMRARSSSGTVYKIYGYRNAID